MFRERHRGRYAPPIAYLPGGLQPTKYSKALADGCYPAWRFEGTMSSPRSDPTSAVRVTGVAFCADGVFRKCVCATSNGQSQTPRYREPRVHQTWPHPAGPATTNQGGGATVLAVTSDAPNVGDTSVADISSAVTSACTDSEPRPALSSASAPRSAGGVRRRELEHRCARLGRRL